MADQAIAALTSVGLPILLVWVSLAGIFMRMADRKGVRRTFVLIGAFPAWALFFGAWLALRAERREPVTEEDAELSDEDGNGDVEEYDTAPPARGISPGG